MLNKILKNEIILAIIISLYSVIFLWGFWSKGIFALGFNASIFGLLFLLFFLIGLNDSNKFFKNNFYWFIPIFFLILSFSIYENPFLKVINIILLPIITLGLMNFSLIKFKGNTILNLKILYKIIGRRICLKNGYKFIRNYIDSGSNNKIIIIKKIIFGLIIFIGINSIIILLLSSADKNFGKLIGNIFDYINIYTFYKTVFFIFLFILLISIKLLWKEDYELSNENDKKIDDIISGIVLGGTLIVYLLFIGIQIDTIFINKLPINMSEVANLVKSGFWQLFFISIINIIYFFVYYKKTSNLIQKILIAFIFASLVILISAGNKMFMYVYNYGFSYEKFFASYTIIYFGIIFILMISFLFLKNNKDILKISILLALWMYSLINILPTEIIIFETNLILAKNPNSKIQRYQSHILSIDILKSVNKLKGTKIYKEQSWDEWTKERLDEQKNKKSYEKNINNLLINKT